LGTEDKNIRETGKTNREKKKKKTKETVKGIDQKGNRQTKGWGAKKPKGTGSR